MADDLAEVQRVHYAKYRRRRPLTVWRLRGISRKEMNKHVSVRVPDVKWEKETDRRWNENAKQAECKRCREIASASAARTAKQSPKHATRTGFACRVCKVALCLGDCQEYYHEDLFRIREEDENEMVTSDEDDNADGEASRMNVEQLVDEMHDESLQLLIDGLRRADKKAHADDADVEAGADADADADPDADAGASADADADADPGADAGELTTDDMVWVPRYGESVLQIDARRRRL